jgi:hypothetical protein
MKTNKNNKKVIGLDRRSVCHYRMSTDDRPPHIVKRSVKGSLSREPPLRTDGRWMGHPQTFFFFFLKKAIEKESRVHLSAFVAITRRRGPLEQSRWRPTECVYMEYLGGPASSGLAFGVTKGGEEGSDERVAVAITIKERTLSYRWMLLFLASHALVQCG